MALQSLESNAQLPFATRMEDWTCLGQHKRHPEFQKFHLTQCSGVPTGDDHMNKGLPWWLSGKESACSAHTHTHTNKWATQVALVVKNPPASSGEVRDMGLITGFRRSSGGENGIPLQDSCLENPMDRGASWATVHGVEKS